MITARMNRVFRLLAAVSASLMLTSAPAAAADVSGDTLKRIAARGALLLGYQEGAMPFSYSDDNGNPLGYGWALCQALGEAIQARLGLASLPVIPVPVTPNNRLLQVRNGMVDIECSGTGINPSRQRQVAFSAPIYIVRTKVMVANDSPVRGLTDLDGKRVITVRGSAMERQVKTAMALRNANMTYLNAATAAEAIDRVGAGQADAFVMEDHSLAVELAMQNATERFRLLDDDLAMDSLGLAFDRADPELKQLIDDTLAGMAKEGALEARYDTWFQQAIPPKGINLQLPMSPLLRDQFKAGSPVTLPR